MHLPLCGISGQGCNGEPATSQTHASNTPNIFTPIRFGQTETSLLVLSLPPFPPQLSCSRCSPLFSSPSHKSLDLSLFLTRIHFHPLTSLLQGLFTLPAFLFLPLLCLVSFSPDPLLRLSGPFKSSCGQLLARR